MGLMGRVLSRAGRFGLGELKGVGIELKLGRRNGRSREAEKCGVENGSISLGLK